MILFIDSSNFTEVHLALINEKRLLRHKFQIDNNLSEKLLPEIQKFLGKYKIKLSSLKKLAVVIGPGPFSRVRTAVATVNALAFSLKIPVIGLKTEENRDLTALLGLSGEAQTQPFYDREPNITKPRLTTRRF